MPDALVGVFADAAPDSWGRRLLERAYGHKSPRRNLHDYFIKVRLPNIQWPSRRYYTTNDPVMTPELLDHFFNQATQGFAALDDRKLRRRVELEVRDRVDLGTIGQVFLNEDYGLEKLARCAELLAFRDAVLAAGRKPLIIDCGGNIGLASRYFAENHPGAKVLCVEPDPGNARQARRNNPLPSVQVYENAIGSEPSRARIVDPGWGNNAFRIDRSEDGGTEIITINDLLRQHDPSEYVPFIAKIDIEGFEAELFARNTEWLERFPLVIVELHDWMLPRSASTRPYLRTIAAQDRDFVYHGENTFSISNTLL